MKKIAVVVVLFATVGQVAGLPATAAATENPAGTQVVPPPVVVAGKPVVKKDEKPKTEKEPVILGTVITRPNGTFLGVEVLNGQIKVSFYNKKKKPMAIDVTRGLARWPNPRGPGQVFCPLNPATNALLGSKPALPPYSYSISINLLQGEGENAKTVENYMVPFRG